MRRKPVIQSELPRGARAVFERKVAAKARRDGDCVVTDLQPSSLRPCIHIGGLALKAHQWAYAIYRGSIPAGLNVCHSCDVGRCINPDHLWLGTQAENVADMDAKGRRSPLSGRRKNPLKVRQKQKYRRRPGAKQYRLLTEEEARQILGMRGRASVRKLSAQTGVSKTHIWNIWNGARRPKLQSPTPQTQID